MNLTAEGVSAFVTAFIWFYGVAVNINQIRKGFNYTYYIHAIFGFFGIGMFLLLWGIANFFLLIELARIAIICYIIVAFFALLGSDALNSEQVEPIKLSLFLILGSITVIFLYIFPDMITLIVAANGFTFYFISPIIGSPFLITCALAFIYYLYCLFLVNRKAPTSLKKFSRIYLFGMFFAICAFVLWIFFAPIIPGIPFTLAGIGGVMMFFAYSHEPKLLFILPFTAIRLTVIDTSVGYPIFTHTWNHKGRLADETLFSGMLHGVSMIIQESLQSGEVQEIRVTDAIIPERTQSQVIILLVCLL